MPRTEREILAEIRAVHIELSPENLACDGERFRADTRRQQKKLVARLRSLERELGRTPAEEEI